MGPFGRRVLTAAIAFGASRAAWSVLRAFPPGGGPRWTRANHRGDPVSLLEGPAYSVGLLIATAVAPGVPSRVRAGAAIAVGGAAAFGVVDDLAESGSSKGLRGHLRELARGRLTTGGLKVLGIGASGLAAAALVAPHAPGGRRRGPAGAVDLLVGGALVAGCANLVNLLDLRPGRALKAVILALPALAGPAAGAGLVAASAGAAVAMLPPDLGERAMLGDTGANGAGALLGTALVVSTGRVTRAGALGVVVALTLASEKVSFTRVIESTPGLRELDAVGRAPR
jgi:hypothetical protein